MENYLKTFIWLGLCLAAFFVGLGVGTLYHPGGGLVSALQSKVLMPVAAYGKIVSVTPTFLTLSSQGQTLTAAINQTTTVYVADYSTTNNSVPNFQKSSIAKLTPGLVAHATLGILPDGTLMVRSVDIVRDPSGTVK